MAETPGGWVSKGKAASVLPEDLPSLEDACRHQPDGAVYASDNGKRYRLHHPRWTEVLPRVARGKKNGGSK